MPPLARKLPSSGLNTLEFLSLAAAVFGGGDKHEPSNNPVVGNDLVFFC